MIVMTGFEPFGKFEKNPSWEAVKDIEGVERFEIPVVFREARMWGERIAEMDPDFVIATGLAPSTRKMKVEALALNVMHSEIADNSGYMPTNERIYEDGEDCMFTGIPYDKLVEYLNSSGIPARISFYAGTYVCNTLYYSLLHNVGKNVIFIHVPPAKEFARGCRDCWKMEDIRKALEKILDFTSLLSSP